MKCPSCKSKSLVTNTYIVDGSKERRYRCSNSECDKRFITREVIQPYGKTKKLGRKYTLKVEDVVEIKKLLATGEMQQAAIAEMFLVSRAQISKIALGLNWAYVQVPKP